MQPPQIIFGPRTSDGKHIFTPAVFPGNQNIYFAGVGDNVAAGTRGGGAKFTADINSTGEHVIEWQFIDAVYIIGGYFDARGGSLGDTVSLDLVAPATAVTPNGTNEGNCNLAGPVIVPAAGDGAYDVDYTSALNANLESKGNGACPDKVTAACPVPAVTTDESGEDAPNGFWDVDSDTGVITPAIGGAGEKLGWWHLLAAEVVLTRWVSEVSLWDLTGDRSGGSLQCQFNLPAKAKKVLPHWICRATFEVTTVNQLGARWMFYMGRTHST